jgi:SpoVK/Ycf46/Vps4 family AAA+-type ATPase
MADMDEMRRLNKRLKALAEAEAERKTLEQAGPKTHVAEVVFHGQQIQIPEGMEIVDAITTLMSRMEYLDKEVALRRQYDAFPHDGANALNNVLARVYGWAQSVATPSWFGAMPPQMLVVNTGPGETTEVPWGRFTIPGVAGWIATDTTLNEGRYSFVLQAAVKRKDSETIKQIMDFVGEYLKENSLYRGKALKIRFRDDDGDPIAMPEPEFIDTSKIQRSHLVFSRDVMDAVETNLFTPIERVKDFQANGLPIKRAVLLEGTYGTGKTLASSVAAKLAVESGITFVECSKADELVEALQFARQYQSPACVVFCEDVDRELEGERDAKMDDLLNVIDGVDSKHSNIITVLTTNAVENINAAMLRPGRLDAVIAITPPDAKAIEQLIRIIGGEAIDPNADLSEAGEALEGKIPAVVTEVVKRAKIVQLRRQAPGTKVGKITGPAIVEAARTMQAQLKLLDDKIASSGPKPPMLHTALVELVQGTVDKTMTKTKAEVSDIAEWVANR